MPGLHVVQYERLYLRALCGRSSCRDLAGIFSFLRPGLCCLSVGNMNLFLIALLCKPVCVRFGRGDLVEGLLIRVGEKAPALGLDVRGVVENGEMLAGPGVAGRTGGRLTERNRSPRRRRTEDGFN